MRYTSHDSYTYTLTTLLHYKRWRRRSRVQDVSREKVFNRRRRLLGRVFVHGVPRARKHDELKFPLHLRHREFGVQTILNALYEHDATLGTVPHDASSSTRDLLDYLY